MNMLLETDALCTLSFFWYIIYAHSYSYKKKLWYFSLHDTEKIEANLFGLSNFLNCVQNIKLKSNFEFYFLTAGQAGAVDEESFIQAFEDVKKINIFNGRSVTEELNKIKEILTKTSNDWKLRMETCGNMRALLLAGAAQYDELFMGLKTLEVAFQNSVKDLRSQVKKKKNFFSIQQWKIKLVY